MTSTSRPRPSLFSRLWARATKVRDTKSRPQARCRPQLEALEDRTLPALSVAQVVSAFGISSITLPAGQALGQGQTVAIIDMADDPNLTNSTPGMGDAGTGDLAQFDANEGIVTPSSFTFTKVGFVPSTSTTAPHGTFANSSNTTAFAALNLGTNGGGETAMDVEWVHAIAPGANVILVEYPSGDSLGETAQAAASLPGVTAVSISIDGPESSDETNNDSHYTTPTYSTTDLTTFAATSTYLGAGVTYLVAAGDNNNQNPIPTTAYPADSPNVISVAWVDLTVSTTNGTTSYSLSTGAHSGGSSKFEPEPGYQQTAFQGLTIVPQPPGSTSPAGSTTPPAYNGNRLAPDVGFNGARSAIYNSVPSTPQTSNGGSSLATPCFAGLIAITNQLRQAGGETGLNALAGPGQLAGAPNGQALEQLYALYNPTSSTYFTQPTFGVTPPYEAETASGAYANYNTLSGLGTPIANLLLPALAGPEVTFSPPTSQVTAGAPFQITVTLKDAVTGATLTGYTGTIQFSSTDPQAVLPANYTFTRADQGSHTFTFTLNSQSSTGLPTITATDATWTNITGTTPIVVASPGTVPTTTTLVDVPNPSASGGPVTLTATVTSASGSPTGAVSFFDNGALLGATPLVNGTATFSTRALTPGTHDLRAVYSGDGSHAASSGALVQVVHSPTFSTFYYAVGSGPGVATQVSIYDENGKLLGQFNPFAGTGFTGGLRVAIGDVNGDGIPDLIVGSGPGGITAVLVYDGTSVLANPNNPTVYRSFNPYGTSFGGGVFVAVGRLDGQSAGGEIITGADAGGGPQVNIYSAAQIQANQLSAPAVAFYAYAASFTGGVRVAVGDVNGDGLADLITAAGPGAGPQVNVYFGAKTATFLKNFTAAGIAPNLAFYAFGPAMSGFTGGVYVTSTFVNGDGRAFIILGAGAGGGPEVTLFSGAQLTAANPSFNPLSAFFALPTAFTGGVRVGSTLGFLGNGNFGPVLLTGAGPGGGPQLDEFDALAIFKNPAVFPFAAFDVAPSNSSSGVFPSVT